MTKNNQWHHLSTTAYGPNALYVPIWGRKECLEIILVMNQNYPNFKTHQVLDCFSGYTSGAERFEKNHSYRVLGWDIDRELGFWSFLLLPEARNDVYARVMMQAGSEGVLDINIEMHNPSAEEREWEFFIYITPGDGLDLPGLSHEIISVSDCSCRMAGLSLEMHASGLEFKKANVVDSNDWINFPLNAEASYSDLDALNRYKKRLKINLRQTVVPAGATAQAHVQLAPQRKLLGTFVPKPVHRKIGINELPYRHALWEAEHNMQYVESEVTPGKLTARVVPARQWYKFFIWDAGMTALGVLELNQQFCDEILNEMPEPEVIGTSFYNTYNYGTFLPTAIYALWELYGKTLDRNLLSRHFLKMQRLLDIFFVASEKPEFAELVLNKHGSGADDNPVTFYCKAEIFAWDYKKTLPVNPERVRKYPVSVGFTSHYLRFLKILRNTAYVLGDTDSIHKYSDCISLSQQALNQQLWNEQQKCYFDFIEGEKEPLEISWIFCCLPLLAGAVPEDNISFLLSDLKNSEKYMTPYGLTLVPQDSPYFRQDGYPNGSAWPPLQYFFWKAAYNIGEMELARTLADKWMAMYEKNHKQTLCCWEQFRCNTGKGAGNSRFSGFLTPVISLWASRQMFGRVQFSQDIIPRSLKVDDQGESAEFVFLSPFYSGKSGFSIVLKPELCYRLTLNGKSMGTAKTDKHGFLCFSFEISAGETDCTLQISSAI